MQEQHDVLFPSHLHRRPRPTRHCHRGWIFPFLLVSLATGFVPPLPALHRVSAVSVVDGDNRMAEISPRGTAAAASSERGGDTGDMRFGRFVIPEASIFLRNERAAAFVNLRPIVPGHVLVIPHKIVPRLEDLEDADYHALWGAVRTVQSTLRRAYPVATAFNVAVQDGRAAGQSVPHVHVHVLPRVGGDFERNDDVYEELDAWAPTTALAAAKERTDVEVPDDADRRDRTPEQMAEEAALYRRLGPF